MSVNVGQRNVPDTPQNQQLDAGIKARELALHTIKICNNKNIFIPEYQTALTDDIVKTAKDIYIDVRAANNIRVISPEDWKDRSDLQKSAYRKCVDLLTLMNLAKPLFHINGKKMSYWSKLTIEAREIIKKWHDSDNRRYGKI